MDWMKIAEKAQAYLRKGDLTTCEKLIVAGLEKSRNSPFHIATQLNFTNPPEAVAGNIDEFIRAQKSLFSPKAAYLETCGFDVNPDKWYYDLFAYKVFGGHEDYEWLTKWDSDDVRGLTLNGMEPLQEVYASGDLSDEAADLASLLVIVKFQRLIQKSIPFMKSKTMPILASGHDYDFIYEG